MLKLDKVLISKKASDNVNDCDILYSVVCHMDGDWGTIRDDFKARNDTALKNLKGHIVSSYEGEDGYKFLIITHLGEDGNVAKVITPEEF